MAWSTAGYFAYQNYKLKKTQATLTQATPTPVSNLPSPTIDPTANWQTYDNTTNKYEFKYPKDWRVAVSIMEYRTENYQSSTEDWVMVTNLSIQEEKEYLKELKDYIGIGGPFAHVHKADGRSIIIHPVTRTTKELKKEFVDNKTVGYELSNFREITTTLGISGTRLREKITWEMNLDNEVALFSRPKNPKSIWILIERNDGNFESKIFDQVLSTFKFTESTSDTTTCAYKTINIENFKDIDTYIKNDVCQNNYLTWETATSPDLFRLKHPDYFSQNLDYGADSFEIEHPNLGKFRITTFSHDYYGKTNSFGEKVCKFAEIGHISKDTSEYDYYKDSLGKYYIVGTNKTVILEDKTPNTWGISISEIQNKNPTANNEEQLIKTEDFKCFIRSIELLN